MGDRAGSAARRSALVENQANVVLNYGSNGEESVSGSSDGDIVKEVVRVLEGGLNYLGMFRYWQWIPECN